MRIATLGAYYAEGVRRAGHECVVLSDTPRARGFHSDLGDRLDHGRALLQRLQADPVDLLLDAHGSGLLFVEPPNGGDPAAALLHHRLDIPLVSTWSETFRIYFKGLEPELVWRCLQSLTWHKAIAVRSHLEEMRWFGIPGCFHLPIGAQEDGYATGPAAPASDSADVLFVGSQQTRYFAHGDGVDTRSQVAGGLALAAVTEGSARSFLEAVTRYGLLSAPSSSAAIPEQVEAVRTYYAHKLFYTAWRNLALRDRFVLRLHRELGPRFRLIGHERWREHYGLPAESRVDYDTYRTLLRSTPICLNMSNGDNTSGLNVRHFEIPANGGFMLCYDVPEVHEVFEVGKECETFRTEVELLEKIEDYLADPERRNAVARAGQQRIMREHLLRHRVTALIRHVLPDAGRP